MSYVTVEEIQQWVEATKLPIDVVEGELETSAMNIAFNTVSAVYTTTGWIDVATTPALVRQAIAMLIAAWTYNRAYSEEDPEGSGYAQWLENKAMALLGSIATGTIDLIEVEGTVSGAGGPTFYPNDDTELEDPHSAAKFTMGSVF